MMPKVLWDTTLRPKMRRLLRRRAPDRPRDQRGDGKDPSAGFQFIMERGQEAADVDVSASLLATQPRAPASGEVGLAASVVA
jgi:hypothetical protein